MLRNGLVVFQFTTSIILIIGTLVIYNQTQYLLNKNAGFDKDQVLLVQGTNTLGDKTEAFKMNYSNLHRLNRFQCATTCPSPAPSAMETHFTKREK